MKLSINKLAEITGQDRRRIKRCLQDLVPTIEGRSHLYESTEAVPLLYIMPGNSDTFDLSQERARLAHHQANIASLNEHELDGELVRRDDAIAEVSSALANMKAKLLNLPPKMASVVVAMDDVAETKAVLESAVYEAITELYNQYADIED